MSDVPHGEAVTVTRSEERLTATTIAVPVRRAVLRKVIVSEERTITVTVRHEEFRLDYEVVNPDSDEAASTAVPFDLVLHEEQVNVTTTIVPVERVRVAVQQVTEDRIVSDVVRLEQVDIDGTPQPNDAQLTQPRHRV